MRYMGDWCVSLDGSTVPSREAVGNKARGIAFMRSHGLPVPPAFVVPTHVGRHLDESGNVPDEVWHEILAAVGELESTTGRTFGGPGTALLVSVRSGAAQSMPGMMDTILNLGMNAEVEAAVAAETGDAAFAADTHRRFVEAYTKIVGQEPPSAVHDQLRGAVQAVIASWGSDRAKAYRKHQKLSDDGGTAVTVQAMVFGNLSDDSGTGVFFTRNPETGEREPYGEFLVRGQGEDVVSGSADPLALDDLAARMPTVHAELLRAGETLENLGHDVQDIEFTVEAGRLYLLQTRNAKRSPEAAIRLAVDLANEGLITPADALARVQPEHIETAMKPRLAADVRAAATLLAKGDPACPGIASGRVVTDPHEAIFEAEDGPVVLVRRFTSPDDVHGMIAAQGVCTEVGGRTSHAAVVSRELGRPCIVGCGAGAVDILEGREITLDGGTGEVFDGILPTVRRDRESDPYLGQLLAWAADASPDHPLNRLTTQTQ
jgi:pyruvate,orthophosphate dikinase